MRRVVFAFIAGFLATITFHQIALALLHAAHVAPHAAWSMQPVPPFGVPSVISLSFWGGVWGIIMILLIDRFRGAAYWIWSIVFGAIAPGVQKTYRPLSATDPCSQRGQSRVPGLEWRVRGGEGASRRQERPLAPTYFAPPRDRGQDAERFIEPLRLNAIGYEGIGQ